jgi:hypothetical protein
VIPTCDPLLVALLPPFPDHIHLSLSISSPSRRHGQKRELLQQTVSTHTYINTRILTGSVVLSNALISVLHLEAFFLCLMLPDRSISCHPSNILPFPFLPYYLSPCSNSRRNIGSGLGGQLFFPRSHINLSFPQPPEESCRKLELVDHPSLYSLID